MKPVNGWETASRGCANFHGMRCGKRAISLNACRWQGAEGLETDEHHGAGVNELRVRAGGAFRVIYVAKFAEDGLRLHAFEKKARRTALLDIELARSRFRNLIHTRRSQ